jgi:DNA-binding LacI/PurR family transcriptional regulator
VVSFDNVPIAAMVTPSLTTVDLPRIEAGRLAAEVLNAVLVGATPGLESHEARHVLLPARLVVRRSTAVLSGSAEALRSPEAAPGLAS